MMDRVYGEHISAIPPVIPFPGSYGFVQGNPDLTQFLPTNPGAFWFHYVTESLLNVIVAAGLTPDPRNLNQFQEAVAILIAQARGV